MNDSHCRRCGQTLGGVEFRYQQVRYPYNPEWQVETLRAGVACCASCLAELVKQDAAAPGKNLAAPSTEPPIEDAGSGGVR